VSNYLGDDGEIRQRKTVGDNVGDDVGNDVGDRDDGVNVTSNNADIVAGKGDGGDTRGEVGGAPGGGCSGGSSGGSDGGGGGGGSSSGSCILQGSFAFYCEDIFVWYFFDVWGELARSHLPSHSCHA
jgi:hypothetical protein